MEADDPMLRVMLIQVVHDFLYLNEGKLSSYSLDPEHMDSWMVQRWRHRRADELMFRRENDWWLKL